MSEPVLVLLGEKVALGVPDRSMIDLWTRWINDLEVTRTLAILSGGPMTRENEEAWYDGLRNKTDDVLFAIYELEGMRPIGSTGLHGVNHRHGTATFGIMIGEKSCWNRGYGTEATRLTLDYAFSVLSLHNVMLTVYAYNGRGVRAYEKAGFKLVGRRRGARRMGGRRWDEIYMDAVADEFESPAAAALLALD